MNSQDLKKQKSEVESANPFRTAVSPLRGAVLCALATLFGVGDAFAAPILCYTPPDFVFRNPRACVNPSDIPKFVTALPIPGALTPTPAGTGMVPDTLQYTVNLSAGTQQMLPAGAPTNFKPSTIWGYSDGSGSLPQLPHAPGNMVVVTKDTPTKITYSNQLPTDRPHPLSLSQDWGLASSMPFTAGFTDPIFGTVFGPAGPGQV